MSQFDYFEVPPRAALRPFVESIWAVRGAAGQGIEAVLPNGAVELMFNFGPRQRIVAHGDRELELTYRHAWLAGMQDRRLVHASELGVDHISVRFQPGGAHAFFDLPVHEVTNQVVDLDLLLGCEAIRLRDRLGALESFEARARVLEKWLLRRQRSHCQFPTIRRAIQALGLPSHARAPVTRLCEELGLSNKHLIDRFRHIVGLPPKLLARIVRFQGVIASCKGRSEVDWLDLTYHFGYADQSHLIREFRRLGGVTPSQFLARRAHDEAAVTID